MSNAFQVVVCHKLDSLWKMLLNEDERIFETKQVTDNYKILTSCNDISEYKHINGSVSLPTLENSAYYRSK